MAHLPADTLIERLHENLEQLKRQHAPAAKLTGIGIGAPNANYISGTVDNPPNLNWGESTDLVALVQRHYQLPIVITNDANAAALGEMYYGAAQGMSNFIVITLGTGLGSGIVVNGELIYGANGFAGELGHTIVDPRGRYCACGNRGCLESYVSATGLCRTLAILLAERTEPSELRAVHSADLTSKRIHDAAVRGDAIALAAFDMTARILAMKLADAAAHTAPEAIIITGGLAQAGELLLQPVRNYLEQYLFAPFRGSIKLLRSEIQPGTGAIRGAAALAWHEHAKQAA
jgi:glucokinase